MTRHDHALSAIILSGSRYDVDPCMLTEVQPRACGGISYAPSHRSCSAVCRTNSQHMQHLIEVCSKANEEPRRTKAYGQRTIPLALFAAQTEFKQRALPLSKQTAISLNAIQFVHFLGLMELLTRLASTTLFEARRPFPRYRVEFIDDVHLAIAS